MSANAASFAASTPFDEPEALGSVLSLAQARTEDAHWERMHSLQAHCRADRNYEDYAPAYCAGYVGFAQYGGSFEDAERSLVSNWLRIRGDSRLGLDEAGVAMRAAWQRMEERAVTEAGWAAALETLSVDGPAPAAVDNDAEAAGPASLAFLASAGAGQRAAIAVMAQP